MDVGNSTIALRLMAAFLLPQRVSRPRRSPTRGERVELFVDSAIVTLIKKFSASYPYGRCGTWVGGRIGSDMGLQAWVPKVECQRVISLALDETDNSGMCAAKA